MNSNCPYKIGYIDVNQFQNTRKKHLSFTLGVPVNHVADATFNRNFYDMVMYFLQRKN